VLVVLNFSAVTTRVRLDVPPPVRSWIPRFSTRRTDIGWTVILGREIMLGPYEATVFESTPADGSSATGGSHDTMDVAP
jgi:hypothetical protein